MILRFNVLLSSTEGFSCVPTKFDSALVETPNKADLIQTVAACELKESCYRVPYVEYYYETVHNADGVKEERLKVGGHSWHFIFFFAPLNSPSHSCATVGPTQHGILHTSGAIHLRCGPHTLFYNREEAGNSQGARQ